MQIVAIVISFALTFAALALLVPAVRRMVGVIRRGQPALDRTGNPVGRTVTMLKESFLHTRMLQWTWVGIMHWFVYMAFLFLSTAVLAAYFQLFQPDFAWPVFGHWYPYEWFSEIIGALSTVGIIFLIIYRQRHHPRSEGRGSRFFGSTFWQAYFVEALALLEGAAILFVRAAEWKLDTEAGRSHYPISSWIGDAIYPTSAVSLENLIYAIAAFKISLAMIWLMVIARNLTMGIAWHRFTVWPNIWFKRESSGRTALGAMKPLTSEGKAITLDDLDDLDEDSTLGAGKLEDFSWKGILDFTTCTECGRCQSQCPAWNTEKPLSPKLLILGLRDHAYAKAEDVESHSERVLVGSGSKGESGGSGTDVLDYFYNPVDAPFVIDEDVLWNCTSCGACVQQCPVDIEHVDHIMDMRRYQVLVESNFPAELNGLFKGLENKGNPWNMSATARMDWAKGLEFDVPVVGEDLESLESVDWLFWVGCAGAYEDRAKKTTRAVAELLNMAGVTFGVLGNGETCTGDPARRAGNEFVFQGLAQQNVETFQEYKVKKVVSTCAHCFNTLKNEYKDFGIELEVVHHTQLLNRLVREGKLTPVKDGAGAAKRSITYHDPCYLGRHNDVYTPPRELLEILPGAEFTEMERNSEKSFCCGAGGARMWMEENIGERINLNRTKEAVGTGADQIAVGCPFCRVMLSDGLTAEQAAGNAREEVEVLDVAQMLLASVKGESATKVPAMAGAVAAGTAKAGAGAAAAGTAKAAPTSADVATKAEPEAGDVTVTEDTVTDTADAGPLAKASGGTSLFDTPSPDRASEKTEPAAKAAGGSLFDTPAPAAAPVSAQAETAPKAAGGSLFDTPAPAEAEAEPAETESVEREMVDSEPSETEPSETGDAASDETPAKPAADLGSGGSLFDLEAPAAPQAASAPPATEPQSAPAAETPAEPEVASTPEASATTKEAAPATGAPAGSTGSLFDIAAPEPTSAPVAQASAEPTPSGAAPATSDDVAAPTTEPSDVPTEPETSAEPEAPEAPESPESSVEQPSDATPAPASTTVSTPATSIPEGGSLFDIEAPQPVAAPAAATAPAPVDDDASGSDAPAGDAPTDDATSDDVAAPTTEPSDVPKPEATAAPEAPEAPESPESSVEQPSDATPAPTSTTVSTPATSIPEGGSLFDIEAPQPVAAPAAATAPAPVDDDTSGSDAPAGDAPTDDATSDDVAAPTTEPSDVPTEPETSAEATAPEPETVEQGSTETLSAGAALSQAATFAPEEDEEAVAAPKAEAPEAESTGPEAAEDAGEDAPDTKDERVQPTPESSAAPQAPRGDVHTPKTDVDINASGSLFDL